MMRSQGGGHEQTQERDRKSPAWAGSPAGGDGAREAGRFSARRKTDAILRMLRGEPLDTLARELGVTAATLAHWREEFLAGGQAALKSRPADERDDEIRRLITPIHELFRRPGRGSARRYGLLGAFDQAALATIFRLRPSIITEICSALRSLYPAGDGSMV